MISLSNSKRVIIVVLSVGFFIVLSALALLAAALASCVGAVGRGRCVW